MKKAIKNNIPIVVELYPNRDVAYSGICLKASHEIFILIGINEDSQEYDGILILRSQEIEDYRYLKEDELLKVKNDTYTNFADSLPLDKMNTFYECLNILRDKGLIAIYTSDDDESYYVGKIKKLTKIHLLIHIISEDAKWLETKKIAIKEITYLGFDSSYEKELIERIK